ncbi:protein of unknown function (plasmid) [Azospirillum lipoferum 4B]|uniref:Uncharacterized protein n=1 Tax=Azospirillum lipoferum (strain 4B) TaxID=862719 RepID=G7ZH32_AZOL4|nr:protein of unknown function [Azospirillum lipoferum 4B]
MANVSSVFAARTAYESENGWSGLLAGFAAAPDFPRFVHCNTQPFPECRAIHRRSGAYKIA